MGLLSLEALFVQVEPEDVLDVDKVWLPSE